MGSSRLALVALSVWLGLLTWLASGAVAAEPHDFEAQISFVLPVVGERLVAVGQGVAEHPGAPQLETLALDGFVAGSVVVPITDPLVSNGGLVALGLEASLRTGELRIDPFAPPFSEPALAQGALALRGELRFCLLVADCSVGIGLPLGAGSGTRGLGVGGIVTFGGGGSVRLSLYGAPFTLATASVMGATASSAGFTLLSTGSLHGPFSFTSTAGLTVAGVGGWLGLVTPTRVVSSPLAAGGSDLPGFARIEIQLLPEPAALTPLLLGAALLLAGRRRRGRSREAPESEAPCSS